MSDKQYSYTIGGKPWTQRPLVMGQWKQLMAIIKGVAIPAGAGIAELTTLLGDRMPLALAVILIEDGGSLRQRFGLRTVPGGDGSQVPEWYQNPEVMLEIANEIEAGIDAATIMRVIDDFLSCNPVSLILERLAGVLTNASQIQQTMTMGLKPSSPSSPEEISPKETVSSGDTLPENASPTSNSESGKSSTENP